LKKVKKKTPTAGNNFSAIAWHFFQKLPAANRGFSLIELLVTIAIIIALAGVSSWLLIGLTTISSDTNQRLRQYTTAEQIIGFLNSRISVSKSADIGQANNQEVTTSNPETSTPAGILPPSWAGDQLVFASQGQCYRLMYIKRFRQLWLAESSSCSALLNSQGLIRGPNQQIDGSWGPLPNSSSVYDPVLDRLLASQAAPSGVRTFLLAEGLAAGSQPLFSYYRVDDSQITTDAEAALGSSNPLYSGSLGAASQNEIFAVRLQPAVLGNPGRAANDQRIAIRNFDTNLYPNQLVLQGGGG
jgi:prepilin-type N-terminal cleavage/methylation domain-containing protein